MKKVKSVFALFLSISFMTNTIIPQKVFASDKPIITPMYATRQVDTSHFHTISLGDGYVNIEVTCTGTLTIANNTVVNHNVTLKGIHNTGSKYTSKNIKISNIKYTVSGTRLNITYTVSATAVDIYTGQETSISDTGSFSV